MAELMAWMKSGGWVPLCLIVDVVILVLYLRRKIRKKKKAEVIDLNEYREFK